MLLCICYTRSPDFQYALGSIRTHLPSHPLPFLFPPFLFPFYFSSILFFLSHSLLVLPQSLSLSLSLSLYLTLLPPPSLSLFLSLTILPSSNLIYSVHVRAWEGANWASPPHPPFIQLSHSPSNFVRPFSFQTAIEIRFSIICESKCESIEHIEVAQIKIL